MDCERASETFDVLLGPPIDDVQIARQANRAMRCCRDATHHDEFDTRSIEGPQESLKISGAVFELQGRPGATQSQPFVEP